MLSHLQGAWPSCLNSFLQVKPGFHMIVTVADASPRQARGHIEDGYVKWEHFLNDVADVADQTGTVWGRIERVEVSLKPGFHVIITVIVSICRRLIRDTSPMCRSRSLTVTIIWKPGLTEVKLGQVRSDSGWVTSEA